MNYIVVTPVLTLTYFDAFFVYITYCYAHAPMTSMHVFLFVNNIVLHYQEKTNV